MLKTFKYKEQDANTKYLKIKEQRRIKDNRLRGEQKRKKRLLVILVKGLDKELSFQGLLKYQ